jgi:hypothetical protein
MRRATEPKKKSLTLSHPVEEGAVERSNVSRGLHLSSVLSPLLGHGESKKKRPARFLATDEQFRLFRHRETKSNPLCPAKDSPTRRARGEQGDILISGEVLKPLGIFMAIQLWHLV